MIAKEEIISHIQEDDKEFEYLRGSLANSLHLVDLLIEDDKKLLERLKEAV